MPAPTSRLVLLNVSVRRVNGANSAWHGVRSPIPCASAPLLPGELPGLEADLIPGSTKPHGVHLEQAQGRRLAGACTGRQLLEGMDVCLLFIPFPSLCQGSLPLSLPLSVKAFKDFQNVHILWFLFVIF